MRQIVTDDLIQNIKQKDEAAFGQLLSMYQSRVYSFAFRMLCNEEDADDAVQEIFIKIWNRIGSYKKGFSFNTWLYGIATNYCYDVLRKRKRTPEIINTEFLESVKYIGEKNIETNVSNKQLLAVIVKLTEKLAPKQKTVFVLKELEGLEVSEISAITNLSPEKIKSNLYVAKNEMRKLLNAYIQNEQN